MAVRRTSVLRKATPVPEEPLPASGEPRDLEVHPGGSRIGELLVQKQLVSRSQLIEALLQQTGDGSRLGQLLVDLGALGDRDLASVLAEQKGVALADLRRQRPDPKAVNAIPEL